MITRYLLIILTLNEVFCFQWIESNNKFDCAVGISYDYKPISIGIFVSTRTVITAANPLNQYLNETDKIKVHTISNTYTNWIERKVDSVAGNQSYRKQSWITIGYNDTTHTSIHDLLLINVIEADRIERLNENKKSPRRPFPVKLPDENSTVYEEEWVFAGFGYIDLEHIKDNTVLEASDYYAVLANCDEWIPREWGRFICILDKENLGGIASGAPLFRARDAYTLYGIASFSLKKGKDHILVFTDLRPYVNKLYGYLEDSDDDE